MTDFQVFGLAVSGFAAGMAVCNAIYSFLNYREYSERLDEAFKRPGKRGASLDRLENKSEECGSRGTDGNDE